MSDITLCHFSLLDHFSRLNFCSVNILPLSKLITNVCEINTFVLKNIFKINKKKKKKLEKKEREAKKNLKYNKNTSKC